MTFQGLAFLLMPAEPGRTGAVVETDERWTLPEPPGSGTDVMLWGRGPLSSGMSLADAARFALRRERALRSIRRRPVVVPSSGEVGLHRLPPPTLAGGAGRNRIRTAILSGALVELWSVNQVRRVIDEVAEAAGGSSPVTRFAAGSGGSAVIRTHPGIRGVAIVRAARSGDPVDPRWAGEALATLERNKLRGVPRLLGQGEVAGASWTSESVLAGRRPARLLTGVAHEVAEACAAFPRSERPADAHDQDLHVVADTFPRWSSILADLANEVNEVARAVPSAMRHGDMWTGNLLVRGRHLAGIVDWDAWHPSALPGTDLLHLVAMDQGLRAGRGLGETWLRSPWTTDVFRAATADYWAATRIAPNERLLSAVGIAWWAGQVAASVRRLPLLAEDDRWAHSNVDQVLEGIGGRG